MSLWIDRFVHLENIPEVRMFLSRFNTNCMIRRCLVQLKIQHTKLIWHMFNNIILYRVLAGILCASPHFVYPQQRQLAKRRALQWEESTSIDSRLRSMSHTWCHLFSESHVASSCVNTETITWRDASKCKFTMITIMTTGGEGLWFLASL